MLLNGAEQLIIIINLQMSFNSWNEGPVAMLISSREILSQSTNIFFVVGGNRKYFAFEFVHFVSF